MRYLLGRAAMVQEVWKRIPSLPQCEASSLGRVRVSEFFGEMPNGGKKKYGGKPRMGCWVKTTGQGRYIFVYRGKTYKVHRLICEAFHGPAPSGKPIVMHFDEDGKNNKPDNLAWGTQKENLNAPGFIEYCESRTGLDNPYIKGRFCR